MFMEQARGRIRGKGIRVVFPEGLEPRTLQAAALLHAQDLVRSVLLGPVGEIRARLHSLGIDTEAVDVRDPMHDPRAASYAATYQDLRRHKGISKADAVAKARLPHYFGALMVNADDAAGMVSGLNSETKPFIPAFEVIRMREGFHRVSSVFIMEWPHRVLFYADCSVNIAPDAATLSEIACATAQTVRSFGIEARVAFLSFSTRDSTRHSSVEGVKKAVILTRAAAPDLIVDGELQFDAAFVPDIARKKSPDSPFVNGAANVFIFPDLNAGNIAYKITERLGGASAIGPILQGLNRPVNDVSRACSAQDLADVAVITAALAVGEPAKQASPR
jgi:phosphate acetyltransferase